jgi:hypothetical protein
MRKPKDVPLEVTEINDDVSELEKKIRLMADECVENLRTLANGVKAEEQGNGDPTYVKPPDRAANEYIINRVLGRPATKKPVAEPEEVEEPRIDLSKVPQERLLTIERWLTETDDESGAAH